MQEIIAGENPDRALLTFFFLRIICYVPSTRFCHRVYYECAEDGVNLHLPSSCGILGGIGSRLL